MHHKVYLSKLLPLLAFLLLNCAALSAQQAGRLLLRQGIQPVPANLDTETALQQLDLFEGRRYGVLLFSETPSPALHQQLLQQDIRLMTYLPERAYLASLPAQVTAASLRSLTVAGVAPWRGALKLAPALLELPLPAWALQGDLIELNLTYYADAPASAVAQYLQNQGAEILFQAAGEPYIELLLPVNSLQQAGQWPFVSWVEPASPPAVPDQITAQSLHRSNMLNTEYAGGRKYDGTGVKVLVRDDGGVGPHIDFKGRLTQNISPGGTHADNVASCMAGAGNLDPRVIGMAPGSDVYVLNYNSSFTDATLSLHQSQGVMITNSSYSQGCNFGYNTVAARVDEQMLLNPSLIHVFSAGNDGTEDCGYGAGSGWGNITGGHKTGKNVLTVGAVTIGDNLASFSSRGPAADGRIKPDVTAMGASYRMTLPGNNYGSASGTSFSAPAAAGVLAQLYHAYKELNGGQNPPAALIKGILLNSADDLGNPGPDYRFGWGRVNARRAVEVLEARRYIADTVTQGETGVHTFTLPTGLKSVRFMVYWPDVPASTAAAFDLVNDLDFSVTGPDTVQHLPWVLDHTPVFSRLNAPAQPGRDSLNNMEQVELLQPLPGQYRIAVTARNLPFGNAPYYVIATWEEEALTVVYPSGGEGIEPGETVRIRWDAPLDTLGFDLHYSLDSGATWMPIAQNLQASLRYYDWQAPVALTGKALVRVSRGMIQDESDAPFSIIGVPNGLNLVRVCQDFVDLVWNAPQGATSYEVFVLGERFMEKVGQTNFTHFQIPRQIYRDENWYAVRALGPGDSRSRRSFAISNTPGQLVNCVAVQPEARFAMDSVACPGATVAIIDSSRNAPEFWNWTVNPPSSKVTFVNGTTPQSQNPQIRFEEPGVYTVVLSAVNPVGTGFFLRQITILPEPEPSFTTLTNGPTVSFFNQSLGAQSYIWDFGDGNSSTLENPVHTYAAPGDYTVTLQVSGTCGDSSLTQAVQAWATGLEDPLGRFRIAVAPNPSTGIFEVQARGEAAGDWLLEVVDLQGKALTRFEQRATAGSWQRAINLNGVAPGIYFLRVQGSAFSGVLKLDIR